MRVIYDFVYILGGLSVANLLLAGYFIWRGRRFAGWGKKQFVPSFFKWRVKSFEDVVRYSDRTRNIARSLKMLTYLYLVWGCLFAVAALCYWPLASLTEMNMKVPALLSSVAVLHLCGVLLMGSVAFYLRKYVERVDELSSENQKVE